MQVQYDAQQGANIVQTITATGTFTGADSTRSRVTLGAGNSAVTFIARLPGAEVYTVRINDPLRERLAIGVEYDVATKTLTVWPAHDGTAITSTSYDIAQAVADAARSPLTADYGGTGLGVVAAGTGATAGGQDPSVNGNRYTHSGTANAGLFVLDGSGSMQGVTLNATLGASVAWAVSLVDLSKGHRVIAEYPLATGTGTSVNVSLGGVLGSYRGLKITAATTGSVSLSVKKA